MCSFGHLSAAAAEEQSRAVTLPLDEFVGTCQPAVRGETPKKRSRSRKVNAIYAADLMTALKQS